jgi:hypothetical protein
VVTVRLALAIAGLLVLRLLALARGGRHVDALGPEPAGKDVDDVGWLVDLLVLQCRGAAR